MAQISLTINSRSYDITCDDGHEEHIRRLAGYVDKRVGELAAAVGQVGEPRLLVMASLLIADELYDAMNQVEALKTGDDDLKVESREAEMADALESCAKRLEHIAASLATA